jgi:glycerophosphoryl diester phosphodiesterase
MNRLLLTGLAAALLGACAPAAPPANPFVQGRTLNIAHQGGDALRPSNTLLAYRNAVSLGVDMLDMDMQATRDGMLVLSHDETLDRLTDTRGRVADLTLTQVLAADAGYALSTDGGRTFPFRGQGVRVAQLSEVLAGFPNTPMIIELKQVSPSLATPFCQALRQAGATSRVIAASFSDVALNEFRAACPEVITSMTEKELRPLLLLGKAGLARLAPLPGRVAQVPVRSGNIEIVTPGFVRAMHARGVAVQVWTVNDPAEMRRLIRMGVDGIITDRPDLLEEVLAQESRQQ